MGNDAPLFSADQAMLQNYDPELNPERLRIEIFSDTDYFFQYVFE